MLDHHILEKTYVFADDDYAEQFIDLVNEFSESMDHNAVITQDNAEIKLQITTNDVKGLTILDFEFALRAEDAADKLNASSPGHPTNAVNEDKEKYILYLDDKPVSVYPSSREANNQAKIVAQKYPSARITVKKEVCTLTPIQLAENLRDWFGKGKGGGAGGGGWDRYNSKGERIGKCGDRKPGEAKPKCLSKSKAAALRAKGGKKAIAAAVRRKRSKDSNPERKGKAINVSNKIKEGRPYDQSNDTLYFFDPNKGGRSFTPQQLQTYGLKQSKGGNWYLRVSKNSDPIAIKNKVNQLEQELNVVAKQWSAR